MNDRYDVVIIGGGVTGLIAAYELVKKGISVAIFEKTNQLGGVIAPFKVKDCSLEGFYHHLFIRDTLILNLVKELGIGISWHITKLAFQYSHNEKYPFFSPLDLFNFQRLSFAEKIRLGEFLAGVSLSFNMNDAADSLAKDWLTTHVGKNVYRIFFEPMLRAKFGTNADQIGADWMLGRLRIRSGRVWGGEKLGYIKGGFGCLIERLGREITDSGSKLYLDSGIEKIIIDSGKVKGVFLKDGRKFYTDYIISTVPPETLLALADMPKDYSEKIRQLEYQWAICIVLAVKRRLTEQYWINMMDKNLKFNVLIEHTNFQSAADYGAHILYLASYPEKNSNLWNLGDSELMDMYLESLKSVFPSFRREEIEWARVFQSRAAGLIYRVGIKKRLPDIQTPVEGLLIGGMFNSYPDRSIDTSAQIAYRCVRNIVKSGESKIDVLH